MNTPTTLYARMVQALREIDAYDNRMCEQARPPDGDDYNEVIRLLPAIPGPDAETLVNAQLVQILARIVACDLSHIPRTAGHNNELLHAIADAHDWLARMVQS